MKPYKRIAAYLIDWMVIGLVLIVVYYFIPESNKITELNLNLNNINEQILNHEITVFQYLTNYSSIIYDLDKTRVIYTAVNILLICIYFIIIPIISKGRTLGLYILGIKIKSDEKNLTINKMFVRNFIVNGLMYMIISFLSLYILNPKHYFLVTTIFAFIQILLVIISVFMIIYRKDKKGLQDILSKTEIIVDKR